MGNAIILIVVRCMKKRILLLILFLFIGYNVFAENEATLKNIKVNNKECVCDAFKCEIEIDADKATVTYELNDSNATVDRLSGFSTDLISPVTTMKVTVVNDKSEEKIENVYTIVINRHQKSNDVSLKEFGINDDNIPLLEDVFVYNYTAKYDTELLKIKMIPNNDGATVITDLEQDFPLDKSSLALDLDVKAENGDVKTYRVVIYRGAKPDTSLEKLIVANNKVELKENQLEYDIKVDYSIISLDIEAVAKNGNATVDIESTDLIVGENEVKITVKNENATSEYILHVTREENKDKSLANLKKLTIAEYPKLNFEENILEYNIKLKTIPEKLTIKATPVTKDAKVEILYNEDLSNEDRILIRVSIGDGDIAREYILTVIQDDNADEENNKTFVLISLIGVGLAIVVLGVIELKKRKKEIKFEITRIMELKKKKEHEKSLSKAKDKIKEKLLKDKKPKNEEKKEKNVNKKEEDDDLEII